MANFISTWIDQQYQRIAQAVADRVMTESGRTVAQARAYRLGAQPHQLKVKPNQYDDNLILNFTGLIVDRSVSQLIGDGIEWSFEGDATTPQEDYINAVWDANHQEILLHRAVLAAAEAGTGYMMIHDPAAGMGSMVDKNGEVFPRLQVLDPAFVTLETMPEDFEIVTRYIIQYAYVNENGREAARRRTVQLSDAESERWEIVDEVMQNGKWILVSVFPWPHPFCPIIHWQNLPTIDSPYGQPDITGGLMAAQDKINADISFLSKSLRLGSDPLRVFTGSQPPEKIDTDKAIFMPDGTAMQLPPTTGWAGDLAYLKQLTQDVFKIARTVDVESLEDKIGSLTNFGLRVIYQDNAQKINTKRELLGDALEELNRRLQLMAGMQPLACEVIWPEFMPTNLVEEAQYWQSLQALGVISKQTLAEKLGLDFEQEQERMQGEQQASDNIGAFLLRGFNRGEGEQMPQLGGAIESTSTRGNPITG